MREVIALLSSYKEIIDRLFMCDAYIYMTEDGELDFEVCGSYNAPALDFYERLELVNQMRFIERLLYSLPHEERKVIFHFYISRHKQPLRQLCDELGVTHTTIYRMRERALLKLSQVLEREKAREEFDLQNERGDADGQSQKSDNRIASER